MKLNLDCIRDILLYIESTSDGFASFLIDSNIVIQSDLLSKYSYDTVIYHLQQCNFHGFLVGYSQSDDLDGYIFYYRDLTPVAHEFLVNIRDNNFWNKTKNIANKIGAKSLEAAIQISSNVITELIKAEFNIC